MVNKGRRPQPPPSQLRARALLASPPPKRGTKQTPQGSTTRTRARTDEQALVHDLAEATVLWAGDLADAAKVGYSVFSRNITQQNALTIGFDNGLLQGAINGWAAAMFSSFNSLPASFKQPFIEILTRKRP